ncbi:MAG: acyl-CoA/acyl-ACP dehydrogenase, partial [Mycobacterium sp.]|nr:acyl-CoA/acyl-ACP dehydrogenase [Mycobacterium sp.]
MSIALTDDHRELGTVARSFLTAQKARLTARELLDSDDEGRPPFWSDLAELGWLGLHVDEEYGGSGFGLPELVVVIDELGRAVAPGPFVPTVTVSAVLSAVGNDEQKTRLLPGLVDGTLTAAVGFGGNLTVSGGRLSGDAGVVIGAGLADVLLLASGEDMILVDRTADGVAIEVPGNLDRTRRSGHVVLTDVAVGDNLLPGARNAALARTRTLYAAEAVGGASDCVDSAVEYAKVREQFGRTIATFQAVKHHCANMLVAAESAVSCVWDAARAAGEDEEQFRLTSAVAATLALPAYVYNAELNIQVHGGIGFTWEHDAHLHLRRALTVQAVLGGDESATDVFDLTAKGIARANSLDLPAGSDELRTEIRAEAQRIAGLDEKAQLDELIATGYLMPHWPKP